MGKWEARLVVALALVLGLALVLLLRTGGNGGAETPEMGRLLAGLETGEQDLSREVLERVNFARAVTGVVEDSHPLIRFMENRHGFDWGETGRVLEAVARDPAVSDEEFLYRAEEYLSLLSDPLTRLSGDTLAGILMTLPVEVAWQDGRLVLRRYHEVLRRAPDYVEMMEPGDRLVLVDGLDAVSLYGELLEGSLYARFPDRQQEFVRSFFPAYYDGRLRDKGVASSRLTFEKPGRVRYTVTLSWNDARGLLGPMGLVSGPGGGTLHAWRMEEEDIAVIRVSRLSGDNLALLQSAMSRYRDAGALILDLRGADPGPESREFVFSLLGYFTPEHRDLLQIRFRNSQYAQALGIGDPEVSAQYPPARVQTVRPGPFLLELPVVVLLDDNLLLPPDLLLYGLDFLGTGLIMGRTWPFAGTYGPMVVQTPYRNWSFQVATEALYDMQMNVLAGRRVEPDRVFEPSLEELKGSGDPVMDRAVKWLKEIVTSASGEESA